VSTEYYYFAASLPMLMPDDIQGMRADTYLSACEVQLSGKDFDGLNAATLGTEELSWHSTTRAWQQHDCEVRNHLAVLRAGKLGVDAAPNIRPDAGASSVGESIRSLFENDSPLNAEEALFDLHWRFLDQLVSGHLFDLDFLIVYYLKVQLLERQQGFDYEKGREVLDTVRSGLAPYESFTELVT
jgi:hypothetical protein